MLDTLFAAWGRLAVRTRYILILAWIVIAIAVAVFFPTIGSVANDQVNNFLPATSPTRRAESLETRFQSTNLASLTLVASSSDALSTADQVAITAMELKIRHFPHVATLQDLGTSPNGVARRATIQAAVPVFGGGTADTLVQGIRALFKSTSSPPGLVYHLTGDLPLTYDTSKSYANANALAQGLSYLVVLVLLLIAFRALLAPIVTLVVAGTALFVSGYVIAEATHIGLQVSNSTQGILIVLVLGAGTDYSVFLLFRIREELGNGLANHAAVQKALAAVGESITFSGFTVMAALMTLLIAEFGIYQSLGPPLAIGVGVMLLAALTLLPGILSIVGRSVFWPTRPRLGVNHSVGWYGRIAERVVQRPKLTLGIGLILLGALCLGQINTHTSGFESSGNGPVGSDSAAGQAVLEANFPGTGTNPVLALFDFSRSIWSNPAPLEQAQHLLTASPGFRSVAGPFGPAMSPGRLSALYRRLGPPQLLPPQPRPGLHLSPLVYNVYRSVAQYITADGKTAQLLTIPVHNNSDSPAATSGVPALRNVTAGVAHRVGAVSSGLYGNLTFAYDISTVAGDDLQHIVPIVAVLIALILALVLRSAVAPLYLVASVLLSYFATLGFIGIVFVHLGGQPGINFVMPFVMFIFLMALGSDYNILVMARIREEALHLPIHRAVQQAIGATGTTVTTAGIILGGTFAAFGVAAPAGSAGDQTRQIGFGIAAGVLMDTFLVRTLLVPSIVVLLGRRNWWPSPLWKHEVIEEPAAASVTPTART